MKNTLRNAISVLLALLIAVTPLSLALAAAFPSPCDWTVPEGYNEHDYNACAAFLEIADENGVKNGEKLSETYDVNDPGTWGFHMESDFFDWWNEYEVDNFQFTETDEGLRIERIYCDSRDILGPVELSGCTSLLNAGFYGAQLGSIDVSGCTALLNLGCGNCGITELDLSENPALTGLSCSYNPISELDVSANHWLRSLRCSSCELTELDLSENYRLDTLACENNPIKELDLTHCPQLRGIDLIRAEGGGSVGIYYDLLTYDWSVGDPERLEPACPYVRAYPDQGETFLGWYDDNGELLMEEDYFEISDYGPDHPIRIARFTGGVIEPDGDIDGSGDLSVADAIMTLRAAMGVLELTEEQIAHGDVDMSGSITVADAIAVLRMAMGL